MWQVGPRISWSTQGQTYSVLTSYSRAFFSPTCTILGMTWKTTTKWFTWAFLCCWDGQIFPPPNPPPSFWWSLSVLFPYWEEIFPCLRNLTVIAVLIEDVLKLFSWGQTIFISHQVKQLQNGRSHLWMSDQRILRYQVMLMDNPGLTISACEVLNPATLLAYPRGLSPLSLLPRNLGPLDKTSRRIVRRSSDQSWGNLVHW